MGQGEEQTNQPKPQVSWGISPLSSKILHFSRASQSFSPKGNFEHPLDHNGISPCKKKLKKQRSSVLLQKILTNEAAPKSPLINGDDLDDIDDEAFMLFPEAEPQIEKNTNENVQKSDDVDENVNLSVVLDDKENIPPAVESDSESWNDIDWDKIEQEANVEVESVEVKMNDETIQKYRRLYVLQILDSQYSFEYEGATLCRPERIVKCVDEKELVEVNVKLRGEWSQTLISIGDSCNVVNVKNEKLLGVETYVIDDESDLLIIVCPDVIISGTTIADSFSCQRKAFLNEKVKSSDKSGALILGVILHELYEIVITSQITNMAIIKQKLYEIIKNNLLNLYAIDYDEEKVMKEAEPILASIPSFLSKLQQQGYKRTRETEETINSYVLGIKGKIDATVELCDGQVVPFELKTGKFTSPSHNAQTMLYAYLLNDYYDINVKRTWLYYASTDSLCDLKLVKREMRSMIIGRNELAFFLNKNQIPPMINNEHQCKKCYQLDSCLTFNVALEKTTFPISEIYQTKIGNATQKSIEFFQSYLTAMDEEEKLLQSIKREIWTESVEEREASGK
ncbi:Dna2-domain-containing protein [Rozella allomycis CSF55]|uniref:Dna2-domain-containing protein n=1 Tax=Rozella allomycis (strain CSF55) TaxID=988480 RepID=A0A4P9YMR1_ROZAC|nr:Dna2-domain-containing protein [Rozella allomycis CSF55]